MKEGFLRPEINTMQGKYYLKMNLAKSLIQKIMNSINFARSINARIAFYYYHFNCTLYIDQQQTKPQSDPRRYSI